LTTALHADVSALTLIWVRVGVAFATLVIISANGGVPVGTTPNIGANLTTAAQAAQWIADNVLRLSGRQAPTTLLIGRAADAGVSVTADGTGGIFSTSSVIHLVAKPTKAVYADISSPWSDAAFAINSADITFAVGLADGLY